MALMQTERAMHGDYPIVASGIDPTVVKVEPELIHNLYGFVSTQLLPKLAESLPGKQSLAEIDEIPGVVAIGDYFGNLPSPDYKRAMYTGLLLSHQDAGSWRLRVVDNHYRSARVDYKVSSHYSVDVSNGEILKARRNVYFIFQDGPSQENTSGEAIIPFVSNGDNQAKVALFDRVFDAFSNEDDNVARVMYRRPINEADCSKLHDRLKRLSSRCLAKAS